MRFRKIPKVVEVDAEQWHFGKRLPGIVGEREATEGGNGLSPEPAMAFAHTQFRGNEKVFEGDWLIKTSPTTWDVVPRELFERDYEVIPVGHSIDADGYCNLGCCYNKRRKTMI